MLTREKIEDLEQTNLAPYAMKSRDSAGRVYPEPNHPTRTCYQRDRDRIVHSEAFRKLEYKTQVFSIFEGDYYRTRLTHTIEVAQIARTIGRNLRLNEDLLEAIALAHDLGHPPFGHAGEEILNDLMKEKTSKGFNHNKRSFEIVTKAEKRYPDFDGLNLTREVLVGILRHETTYDHPQVDAEFAEEGPTLEAQIVDVADSLAYLNHDIDDGLTSGCLLEEDLTESSLWRRVCENIQDTLKSNNREIFKYQIVKALIDIQVQDLLRASDHRLEMANINSVQQVKEMKTRLIGFSEEMKLERDNLQKLLLERFYHHPRVERMKTKAKGILTDIFERYEKNPLQLPYSVYHRDQEYTPKMMYEIICNYVASMTDRAALDEYQKLFTPYRKV